MTGHLTFPASWKDDDDPVAFVDTGACAEIRAVQTGPNRFRQRVADVAGVHTALPVPAFLEGEDAQQPLNIASHGLGPALAPGPGLRSDQIDNWNSLSSQFLSEAQVKIGRIREDREVGPALFGGPH